jgi:N-methylhydantoinase A
VYAGLEAQARAALTAEGFAVEHQQLLRSADLRYAGQAYEVRVSAPSEPVTGGRSGGPGSTEFAEAVVEAFHAEHARRYGYSFAGRDDQSVEWVNLRVTGVGPIRRPELHRHPSGDGHAERALTGRRRVVFDTAVDDVPVYWRPDLRTGDVVTGPAILEEFGSTVPLHPGFEARLDPYRNLVLTRVTTEAPDAATAATLVDPVLVEIVEGSLASIEREVETARAPPARR